MKTFNFTKTMVALSLAGLMGSVAMADEIDSEIAKLKKENELLELKKKNAQLQKSGVSFSNVVESDGEDYTDKLTGFFVGAELGYNSSVQNDAALIDQNDTSISGFSNQATYALPINLAFGYQIYPWQNAGFKVKGYIGYASYNSPFKVSLSSNGKNFTYDGDQKSSAIHYGLEAEYLYDFIASQTHTFGVNLGVGYEFGTFIGQEINFTVANENTSIKQNQKLDGYTISTFTSSAGVHYYYNINHQFELKYRVAAYTNDWHKVNNGGIEYKYKTQPFGSILFAYNYKF